MFRSLALFNYRVWFMGALVSNLGHWLQVTALNWIVLTGLEGGGPVAMGITMALQLVPSLLLVGVAGAVVDRFDRRRVLAVTQALRGLLALAVGVLLLSGGLGIGTMYGFALAMGVAAAIDAPARQVFVSDLVTPALTANAVALNAASFNVARLCGPAIAGILIVAIGGGWLFILNALTFVATLVALAVLRVDALTPRAAVTGVPRLRDVTSYVGQRRDLQALLVLTSFIGTFGINFPLVASTMTLEFGGGAERFGLLTSIFAIGSLSGALLAARRAEAQLRNVFVASGIFALMTALLSAMPGYWWFAALCPLIGATTVTVLTTANGYIQMTTDPGRRGRMLALYHAVNMSGTALGATLFGTAVATWGPRTAILVWALIAGSACAGTGLWLRERG